MNPVLEAFRAKIGKLPGPKAPPVTRWLQGIIRDVDVGKLTVEFLIRPEMANPTGFIHGGILAAMIDDVIGMTVASLGYDTFHASINLVIDYLGRVPAGESIIAFGQVIRAGNKIAYVCCEMKDKNGMIVARGSSNLLRTRAVPDYLPRLKGVGEDTPDA